jgi:alkylated DNA repair dioxygenase AlkB
MTDIIVKDIIDNLINKIIVIFTKKTLICTDKSFLNTFSIIIFKNLIDKCILDINKKIINHPSIILFGKTINPKRKVGFFSNFSIGYNYSKQLLKSQILTENLISLLFIINNIFLTDYNGILVNYYENGESNICKHSDDEINLDNKGVICISIGSIRKFRIRDKFNNKIICDVSTIPYEIIQMGGNFQKEFTHEIPIQKRIKEYRISFTFRKHNI